MSNFQISHKEIAAHTGLSRATVSYALRNSAKIPEATRQRVVTAAKALGYRPDPLVRKLMAHLATARPRRAHATVALFIPGYPASWLEHNLRMRQMLTGAQMQAERHGLHFEQLWLEGVRGMTLKRIQGIVRSRGIDAVIVGSMRTGRERLDFDFSEIAGAAIGYSMCEPALHRACPHHFKMMRGLLDEICRRGFQRIGAIYSRRLEDGSNNLFSASFYATQHAYPGLAKLPLEIVETPTADTVRTYVRRHRPDVIVGSGLVYGILADMGLRVPEEISFASIDRGDPPYDAAGIDGHYDLVAATAVDLVATQLQLNQRGLPKVPKVLMVDAEWTAGPSLGWPRKRNR